jgi:hypothetical protein
MATTRVPAETPVKTPVKTPAPPQANFFVFRGRNHHCGDCRHLRLENFSFVVSVGSRLRPHRALVVFDHPSCAADCRVAREPRDWTRKGALRGAGRIGSSPAHCHLWLSYAGAAGWSTAVYGAGYGLFPIGWIVLNVIFMYQLTVESGQFNILQHSLTGITQDRRLQLLLIAFCFGAFFEGAAGFGTPVAVTAALLIGLGFKPLQASGLSLIANTAPVAFGALGTPIIALAKVTGFSEITLGAMAGRILTPFCILVPFWLVCAFAGWSGMLEVWPAIAVAGVSFATTQLLMSNLHGPWVVNVVASPLSPWPA